MTKNQKKALFIGLGAIVVLGALAAASSKKAKAASPKPEDDEQSPGWPQPDELPHELPQAQQQMPNLPDLAATAAANIPANIQLPTSVPVPVSPDHDQPDVPPTPANVPIPNISIPQRPPASPAEEPSTVSEDTAAMVQRLLAAEARPNWKATDPVVADWQKTRGLVVDGKYGPKTALAVADEIGTLPLVRFWPKGSYPESGVIDEFKAAVHQKSKAAPEPRKSQLLAAMDREQGQGFARNVPAASQLIVLEGQA